MPPKRKSDVGASSDGEPAKKRKPAAPRLKKAAKPSWAEIGQTEPPTGEWATKCIERWCLLPPHDMGIAEDQWKKYYEERAALDTINTSDAPESKPIVSEELGQDTFAILRRASLAAGASILGAAEVNEDERTRIARVLMGSVYLLKCWGNDEEGGSDNPRTVNVTSRVYSPFGTGTSLDLEYNYHYRVRFTMASERFSDFLARARTIGECDPAQPNECTCTERNNNGRSKPTRDAVRVFDRNGSKVVGTTPAKLTDLALGLLGTAAWLSPLKTYELLLAAGTVGLYHEDNAETVAKVSGKLKYFAGETNGVDALKAQLPLLKSKEDAEEKCVPKRMLVLAKTSGAEVEVDAGAGPSHPATPSAVTAMDVLAEVAAPSDADASVPIQS